MGIGGSGDQRIEPILRVISNWTLNSLLFPNSNPERTDVLRRVPKLKANSSLPILSIELNDDTLGPDPRASSQPAFWDERYAQNEHLFGTAPSAFVAGEVHRLPVGASVLEIGAGEGRTALSVAREIDGPATLVDFSTEALAEAQTLAASWDVACTTVKADLRTWVPDAAYDVVLCTFVQLLPGERPGLYHLLHEAVAPEGWILGEWFRPAHLGADYDRMGPSRSDRMVPVAELEAHFGTAPAARCFSADITLDEGPFLSGRAALSRLCVPGRSGP